MIEQTCGFNQMYYVQCTVWSSSESVDISRFLYNDKLSTTPHTYGKMSVRGGQMRNRSLFYKKIQCGKCGGNFKSKKERGRVKYLCSAYDNGKGCERVVYTEERLINAVERRYRKEMTFGEIEEVVKQIIIYNDIHFEIYLTEGQPIKYDKNHITF